MRCLSFGLWTVFVPVTFFIASIAPSFAIDQSDKTEVGETGIKVSDLPDTTLVQTHEKAPGKALTRGKKLVSIECTNPAKESLSFHAPVKGAKNSVELIYRELIGGQLVERRFKNITVSEEGLSEMSVHGMRMDEPHATVESLFVRFTADRADADYQSTLFQRDIGLLSRSARQGSATHSFNTRAQSRLICKPE